MSDDVLMYLRLGLMAAVFVLLMRGLHRRLRLVRSDRDQARANAAAVPSPRAAALARWEAVRWISLVCMILLLVGALVVWAMGSARTGVVLLVAGGAAFAANLVASVGAGVATARLERERPASPSRRD